LGDVTLKRIFVLLSICVSLFSLDYENVQRSKAQATIESIQGIEYIHNTETPLFPDKTVRCVADLSITSEDKSGIVALFKPRLAYVDADENIYFIEIGDQVIKIFDPDGRFIRTIGAKGSGPGEFQSIGFLALQNRKLVVMDQGARRTNFFDLSGKFLRSFQWRPQYDRLILVKENSFIVSEIVYSADRLSRQLCLKEVDSEGQERKIEGEFSAPEPKILRQGKYTIYFSSPVTTGSRFAGDEGRNRFYHCLNDQYVIEAYDASGRLFRKIERPYMPVPFTAKDAKAYRESQARSGNEYIKKAVDEMEMPKNKSIVERMDVDDEGRLWIQTNEKKKKGTNG